MGNSPPFAEAWCAQWKTAAAALARVHDDELRALTNEEALRRTDALLSMATTTAAPLSEARRTGSGLADQQALFSQRRR